MADALDTLCDWIDIPSVTGAEGDYGDALGRHLESLGFAVERQELAAGRFNVLARAGNPRVVFCTHLDTVPPFFGPTRERDLIRGRGSCDAKGPALAMIEASKRLLDAGERDIGFLFTVGEEVDGAGAQLAEEGRAKQELAALWSPDWIVVGEPTGNEFVRGGKGVYKCTLHATGVAGHSSQKVGPSAIHELVGALERMLGDGWGTDELFGEGSLNVGEIKGGLAANVVAPEAEAELLIRAVEEPDVIEARLREHLGASVELRRNKGYGPVRFEVPAAQEGGPVVAFGTDAPFLPGWGTPLLYGPGEIIDAHTDHEIVTVESFERAISDYAAVATELLARGQA